MTGGGDPVQKERQQSAEVNYDGGIDLLEYLLEQGDERLSTRETIILRQDFPLRVGMQLADRTRNASRLCDFLAPLRREWE